MSTISLVVIGKEELCLLGLSALPKGAKNLCHVKDVNDVLEMKDKDEIIATANTLLLVNPTSPEVLNPFLEKMKNIKWIQTLSAGIDYLSKSELLKKKEEDKEIIVTNGKGVYSHSLAEYVIGTCLFFNKDIPRLQKQKENKEYTRFIMSELQGSTMGIIGYGDIGMHCAKIAKAFNMNIIGLRRRPELSKDDPLLSKIYGSEGLNQIMQESDFVVIACSLTAETRDLISFEQLKLSKKGQVLVNIGRGPVINEEALVDALKTGKLSGAALDVFSTEPLPPSNPLWDIPNLIISPHNADNTLENRVKSVETFIDNCNKFLKDGKSGLVNVVSVKNGY